MRQEGYILIMLKHLSARGSLFLFVRTHHHLAYYFKLSDARHAANETRLLASRGSPRLAKVLQIHPRHRPVPSQRQERPSNGHGNIS
jgi:hypothetical protein